MELNNIITQLDIINKCNKVGSPSNTYDELEFGASNTSYTAPANGYFAIIYDPLVGNYIAIENEVINLRYEVKLNKNEWNSAYLPVRKGDTIKLYHDITSGEVISFKFIYNE